MKITVIGAGLAGCEAAWQAARLGVSVELWEMKPEQYTPAHHSPEFAELCCSNSLRAAGLENAVGLLKEELRLCGSLILEAADATAVAAGGALAVDREAFSRYITRKITENPRIERCVGRIDRLPEEGIVVVATGPLTTDALAEQISHLVGAPLSFFDAAAPIVAFESVDLTQAYFASRYGKGSADYINCPMDREQYLAFYKELISGECAEIHEFENDRVFEGCMPIEVMAKRGEDTIRFGPLKPVGLPDPRTGRDPYAVVQLRRDNAAGTMYNLVGFQTHLRIPEQKRIFSMIPGLENAEFLRYGVMHRNTFLPSPGHLDASYMLKDRPGLFFAGQMTGVEGYVESTASGLVAGISAACLAKELAPPDFPASTAIGALAHYISNEAVTDFQPMNVNFGILDQSKITAKRKKDRRAQISEMAREKIGRIAQEIFSEGE